MDALLADVTRLAVQEPPTARESFLASMRLLASGCTRLRARPKPSLLGGDLKQVGQPSLRVSPRRRPQFTQDLGLRLGPERPRDLKGSSTLLASISTPTSPCRGGIAPAWNSSVAICSARRWPRIGSASWSMAPACSR